VCDGLSPGACCLVLRWHVGPDRERLALSSRVMASRAGVVSTRDGQSHRIVKASRGGEGPDGPGSALACRQGLVMDCLGTSAWHVLARRSLASRTCEESMLKTACRQGIGRAGRGMDSRRGERRIGRCRLVVTARSDKRWHVGSLVAWRVTDCRRG
jgi:hypothetical protein